MTIHPRVLVGGVVASLAASAVTIALVSGVRADSCRGAARDGSPGRECRPAAKLAPYEPERRKAGRDPGFVDVGNGTEIRVGGRVRVDGDLRR